MTYPQTPGWRAGSTGETAEAAANAMRDRAPALIAQIEALLAEGPLTPEEAQAKLAARGCVALLTSVRPRFSQLARQGRVTDSGERGLGEGGRCRSIRWRLTTEHERVIWRTQQAEAEREGCRHG
jgi:hypothetical protein